MNTYVIRILVALCFACAPLLAELARDTMPGEVALTTGRTLRNVEVVRWEKDRVVLKHAGGVDPVPFALIREPLRSQLPEIRAKSVTKAETKLQRMVSGQVFVTTRGAGAYKFAGAHVYLLSESSYSRCLSAVQSEMASARASTGAFGSIDVEKTTYYAWLRALKEENVVTSATTDADGMYQLSSPERGTYYIVCFTTRLVGGKDEYNSWAVPVRSEIRIDLNSSNQL